MGRGEKEGSKRKLNARRAAFVWEYLQDPNATQAALRAGYSPKSAHSQGQRLLQFVEVKAAIAEGKRLAARRAEVTIDRIVEEYRRIAFADLREVIWIEDGKVYVENTRDLTIEQAAAISEISETKDGIRVKMHSKINALDSLAKHLGMFTEKHQVELTGPPPVIQLVPVNGGPKVEGAENETDASD